MNFQEKSSSVPPNDELNSIHEPWKVQRKRRHFLHGFLFVCFLAAWYHFDTISRWFQTEKDVKNEHATKDMIDWADIVPSEKLEWHECFFNNFCARLTVPMDYNRPLNESKDNPKVHIGLLMAPGKHPIWEKQSKSPLLINPGGPGGPGTLAALFLGPYIQKIVGESQDVIGFDPRGIASTTPQADCFLGQDNDQSRSLFHRLTWQLQGSGIGLVNSSSDSLLKIDTRARGVAKLCEEKDALDGKDSILRYMHTPSVARDMISIIDAWDEWVASSDNARAPIQEAAQVYEDPEDNAEVTDTKGKLVYWGFSYGTLLGATFASMFPDRVGRVVLDGVVHADHYVAPIWEGSIQDSDAIFDSFSVYCHEAKDKCAMYRGGDQPQDIADRFQGVMDRIKQQPITLINELSNTPVVITYSELKTLIFSTLYSPTATWIPIAMIFNLLAEHHDEIMSHYVMLPELQSLCESSNPYWSYPGDALDAIMCSDKRYPLNETLPNLEARFERMANESSFADIWIGLNIGCDAWAVEAVDPPMRWDDHPAHKQKPINTSFPVLFVSNTHDPVTPLSAGVAMARKFVDAGLIEQKSEGHCSLAAVSKCTIDKLRAYFLLGKVPPHPSSLKDGEWSKCDADEWPFHPFEGDPFAAESEEEKAEIERMMAFKEMQYHSQSLRFWGQRDQILSTQLIAQEGWEGLPHFL